MTTKLPPLTGWFPPEVKPVRSGLYPTRSLDGGEWYESGHKWLWIRGAWHNDSSTGGSEFLCEDQNRSWRGLSADPKAKK